MGENAEFMAVGRIRVVLENNTLTLTDKQGNQKFIDLKDITAVELKKPGFGHNGYIRISVNRASEGYINWGFGVISPTGGSFVLGILSANKYEDAAKMKELIVKRIQDPTASTANTHATDEIRKYKQLCDEGIITQEEFEAKKKQLLGL